MSGVTIQQIADAIGRDRSSTVRRAAKEGWPYIEQPARGGKRRLYALADLPGEVCAAVLLIHPGLAALSDSPAEAPTKPAAARADKPAHSYDPDELWRWAGTRPGKLRDTAAARAATLRRVLGLHRAGLGLADAIQQVAADEGMSWRTVSGWYYGSNGKPGARDYAEADWDAALLPGYTGRTATAEFSPAAWDWFKGQYLTRRQPSIRKTYRRLAETAAAQGWAIPSESAVARRLEREVSPQQILFLRHGPEALRDTYPSMRRDPRVFGPGEAVSGDGLKLDKLYVDWGDDILTTSTVWPWKDIATGRILAHRLGRTENTDLFRLAVYDLTGRCLPAYAQIDNTRAAANKAMTAGAPGRRRFKDQPDDPPGVLVQMGIGVHWTDPDHDFTTPGAKVIERDFRDLHENIATHPKFANRGYSTATAVPAAEVEQVVAEEIARHNAQLGRRTPACGGKKSFDQAWAEAVGTRALPVASQAQRELCLLLPEAVHVNRRSGHVELAAGKSDLGKPRYWAESLARYAGQRVVAYYDPADLAEAIRIQTLDGRYVCHAQRQADTAFNDTRAAGEHRKEKKRYLKTTKASAKSLSRLSALEAAALYPQAETPAEPEPRLIKPRFGRRRQGVSNDGPEHDAARQDQFARAVGAAHAQWKKDRL